MARPFLCSAAVLALFAGALLAADKGKNDQKGRQPIRATITKVDPENQTITVRMKNKQGKEVEKTFQLTEDLEMLDETGQVVAIDVFRAGNDVLLVEQKGRLVGLQKPSARAGAAEPEEQAEHAGGQGNAALGREVDRFIQEYDRNKNGYLEREELPSYLRDQFERLDTNKDKKLSREELMKGWVALQRARHPSDLVNVLIEMSDCEECAQDELQLMYDTLRKLDKNKNGKIDKNELAAYRKHLIEERVDNLIKELDTNHDGRISRQEARGALRQHFDEIDQNKDGYLERDELIRAASEPPEGAAPSGKATGQKARRRAGEL